MGDAIGVAFYQWDDPGHLSEDLVAIKSLLFSQGIQLVAQRTLELKATDYFILFQAQLIAPPPLPLGPIVVLQTQAALSSDEQCGLDALKCRLRPLTIHCARESDVTLLRHVLVTAQRQALELAELKAKAGELEQKVRIAERAKNEFLANMSHEIRTPLGAVLGFSELLIEEGLPASDRQVCKSAIERNGRKLADLVADILDLAQVESGQLEMQSKAFSVNAFLNEIVILFREEARQKHLTLSFECLGDWSKIIVSDPKRIKQILFNIVQNAVKFTTRGSILIKARCEADQLVVQVEDTGVGIDPKKIPALFQPFAQLDSSLTREFGGTGLGLILSRKMARALGGELMLVWTSPGVGSCFQIVIPVEILSQKGDTELTQISL